MSRRVLISGSIAFDNIMVFDGQFKDHILPDRVHMLNVSFLTPSLKREFGGCAANIAYTLGGLGGEPVILAAVGRDSDEYLARLDSLSLDRTHVLRLDDCYTAQCFITTDLADNQITAFHPGAMSHAHRVSALAALPAAFGIVAPNGKEAMVRHARELQASGVPFIFDPGQGLPMFDGQELRGLIASASAVAVNDYEASMLCDRTGWREEEIAAQLDALIVTRGAQGAQVWSRGATRLVPAVAVDRTVDPTGCGDAFRGGLLFGIAQGWDWFESARLGSVLGAMKIECQGPQNHTVAPDAVALRFEQAWGHRPW